MFGCCSLLNFSCFGKSDHTDDADLNEIPILGDANLDISCLAPATVAAARTSFSSYHTSHSTQLPSTGNASSNHFKARDSSSNTPVIALKPIAATEVSTDASRSGFGHFSNHLLPKPPSPPSSPYQTGARAAAQSFQDNIQQSDPISNETGIRYSKFTSASGEPDIHLRQPATWNAPPGSGSYQAEHLRQVRLERSVKEYYDTFVPTYARQVSEERSSSGHFSHSCAFPDSISASGQSSHSETLPELTSSSTQSSQSQDLPDFISPSSHKSISPNLPDCPAIQDQPTTAETFEKVAASLRKLPSIFDSDNNSEEMEGTSSGVSLFSYNNAIGAGASSNPTSTTRRRPKRECVVCSEESSRSHPFPTQKIASTCVHKSLTCKACLRAWILAQLDGSTWDHIACPECDELMQYGDVRLHASAADFRRYDNLSLSSYLSSEEGFFRCLAPRCGAGQIHPSGAAEPIFRCGSCDVRSCIVCNVLWHENRTCAQYQQELEDANRTDEHRAQRLALIKTQEDASAATLEGISKTCPGAGCGARIQKNGGCDHMTCFRCKYDFCWRCSADYNEIRRIGNEAHAKSCRWFDPEAGDMHEADEGEDDEDEEDDLNEADEDENECDGNEDEDGLGNEHDDSNDESNDTNDNPTTPDTNTDRDSMTVEFTQGPRNMATRPLAQPGSYWTNRAVHSTEHGPAERRWDERCRTSEILTRQHEADARNPRLHAEAVERGERARRERELARRNRQRERQDRDRTRAQRTVTRMLELAHRAREDARLMEEEQARQERARARAESVAPQRRPAQRTPEETSAFYHRMLQLAERRAQPLGSARYDPTYDPTQGTINANF